MTEKSSLRSPLGQARGLGSAKSGVDHWWAQRVTAVALIPLALWFVFSIACLAGEDAATVTAWVAQPFNAVLTLLFLLALFYHSELGCQVVIEDYVHSEGLKIISIVTMKLLHVGFAIAAVFAVLKIAFTTGGAA